MQIDCLIPAERLNLVYILKKTPKKRDLAVLWILLFQQTTEGK